MRIQDDSEDQSSRSQYRASEERQAERVRSISAEGNELEGLEQISDEQWASTVAAHD